MVAKTLVEDNVTGGRRLVESLDRKMEIAAAFWLYLPEGDLWRLFLATPEADLTGSRAVYAQIQQILSTLSQKDVPALEDITVVSPNDQLVRAMGSFINTGRSLTKLRLTGNSFNNTYIDDAVIYRMNVR